MSGLRPNLAPAQSVVASFDNVVDQMRQLQTDLGLRPYRVFAVVVTWSGGEVGRGDPKVELETELLPTPMVRLRGIRFENRPGGKTDRGYIEITEISPRYTEDELINAFHVKQPLTEAQEVFWEVQRDARDGHPAIRHRFVLRGMPDHDAENFQWVLRLSAQDKSRKRNGKPARPERTWRR